MNNSKMKTHDNITTKAIQFLNENGSPIDPIQEIDNKTKTNGIF